MILHGAFVVDGSVLYRKRLMAGSSRKLPGRLPIVRWFAGADGDRDLGGAIRASAFFVLFYLYLWLYVDLRLIYHGGGVITNFPIFFRGWTFFEQFTSYPGGLVEYAGAFLAQLFYYSWAGALVVTLLAWSICLCIDCFLKAADAPSLRGLRFVPAILLLVIYSRYTYRLASILALLTALFCVCLYLRATAGRKLSCIVVFGVLSVILYYIAGGGYLLFAAVCAIYEILLRRRWAMGILYLLSGAAVPYIGGVLIFAVSIVNAYSELLPFSWKIAGRVTHEKTFDVLYVLYAFVPLIALGHGLRRRFFPSGGGPAERHGSRGERRAKAKRPGLIGRIRSLYASKGVFRWVVESLVLFAFAVGAVFASYDGKRRIEFEVSYYSSAQMWERLLRSARRHPGNHRVTNAVNRALYHTGRLGYDMFSCPQQAEGFLLTAEKFTVTHSDRFDVRIELGLVCMAENDLAECVGMFGRRPAILKGLAWANMVKGNIGSARIYLGALSKTLFDAGWADAYLDLLESDPNLSTDNEIQRLRARVVGKDHGSVFSDNEQALLALLEKDNTNRMAFEYLMSWYLLTRQLDKFADNIKRLNDLGYSEVPRLYEEALFVYAYETGKSVALDGSWGRPKSGQRIEEFGRIFNSYGRNKEAAFAELAKNYGDSYFFYSVYGFSGVKN